MRAVNAAYEVLRDPVKRAAYDRERQRASQQQTDTQTASGRTHQPSGQTENKQQAETDQRQKETTDRAKTTTGQQHTQPHTLRYSTGLGIRLVCSAAQ